MGTKTFNNVKINLTLKTTDTRANLSTSSEDLAVQLGKIKKWYDDFAWSTFTAPTVEVTGSGNAITSASWSTSTGKLTLTKGETFLTSGTFIPLAGSNDISGNLKFNAMQKGVFLKDSEKNFAGIYYNGSNFWLGSEQATTTHFLGETLISAGYSSSASKGNFTIKVYAPNATNTGSTGYNVFHSGNLVAGTGLNIATAADTTYNGTKYTINHSNSVTAVTTAGLLKVAYDATGHITGSSAVAAGDLPTHTHYEQDIKFDPTYSFKPTDSTRFPLTAQPLINTLRTNRFAFLPASSITIEHSTDGGSTYTDSGYSNEAKCNVFISRQIGTVKIGPNTSDERTTSMRTMITITRDSRYTRIDRFYIWFSTSGHNPYVDIQYATNAADTTWVDWRTNIQLLGWAGPNLINGPVIVFGASNTHVKKIRFIFRYAGIRADHKNSPSQIYEIAAYADYATWTATNTMMMNDHLYYWNYQQQAYFPAEIKVPTQIRVHNGNYGALFRTDGTNTHILLTDSGSALDGSYSTLRPFSINNATGLVTMKEGLTINTKDGAFLEIHGLTTTTYTYGSSSPKIRFTNADSSQNADLIWDDHDTYCTPASLTLMGNQDGTFFCAPRIRLFSAPTAGSLIDIDDTNNKNFHLRYKSSLYGYANIISVYPGPDQYGVGTVFNQSGGGLCIIGGGESAGSLNNTLRDASTSPYGTAWSYGTETMVIGADASIYFVSGANSLTTTNHTDWTHLKTALFDTDGNFRPSIDNKGSIGTSSYKWANMYATTFNGNLTGNVTGQISVTTTNPTSATTYYGIFATAQSGINYMRANDGFRVMSLQGTTSNYGYDYLILGNGVASGTAGNKYGGIRFFGSDTSYIQLTNGYTGAPTSFRFSHSAGTTGADFSPATTNKYDFGTSSLKWRNVHATTLNGTLNGDITAEVSKTSTSNTEAFVPFVAKFDDALPDDGQSVAKKPYFASDYYFLRQTYQSGSTTRRSMTLVLGDPGFSSEGVIIMCDGNDTSENQIIMYAVNPYVETGTGPNLACLAFGGWTTGADESAFIPAYDGEYDLGHPDYKWGYVYAYNFVGALNGNASTASKLGTSTVGGTGRPIYLNSGTATACSIPSSGAWWNSSNVLVPQVSTSGVLEIGRYIDFHATAAATTNYDMRLDAVATSMLTLQSNSGTTQFNISGTTPRLRFTQTTSGSAYDNAACGITAYPGDTYGVNLVIQSGGNTIIGAGESPTALYTDIITTNKNPYGTSALTAGERMYITSDYEIYFVSGASGLSTTAFTDWTNLKTMIYDSNGYLKPSVNLNGSIGTAGNRWLSMYAKRYFGRLSQQINTTRQTTANLACEGTMSMQLIQATSSMTTGKPDLDGYILDFDWDNTGAYKAQLSIPNTAIGSIQWRTQTGYANWDNDANLWRYVHDNTKGVGKTGFLAYPTDGSYYEQTTQNITGALVITLPFTKTNGQCMIHFSVDIYNYNTNQSVTYVIAGYCYNDEKWYSCTAYALGRAMSDFNNLKVRFGCVTGGNYKIQIGETTTVWKYPQVSIRDVTVGYKRAQDQTTYAANIGNWTVTFESSDIANVTQTVIYTRPFLPFDVATGSADANTFLDRTGWFNWNTTTGSNIPTANYGILLSKENPSVQVFIPDNATGIYFRRRANTTATPTDWWGITGTAGTTYNLANMYKVSQSETTTSNYRGLLLGYNSDSATVSNLTTAVDNVSYVTSKLYAQPSTGNLYMDGKCTIGKSSQTSYPTGGIHVHDVRNLTVTPDSAVTNSANFYFHQYTCDGTNNYWWGVLNVRGWDGAYSSWELAGPSQNVDQRTTPLYVRTSNTNSAWGNWRKIYDASNPPTASETGAVPNTTAGVNAAINLLSAGTDDPVDADYYIAQYANGGTTNTNYYRRPVSKLYNYIEDKLQHNAGLNMAHLFSGWNTVGWHRVMSLPCSATASGRIIRTIELTCIRNYNNGQPEVFSVRMIGLYNATEGFEILYSKSNSASTQYIPKIRMTKSSDGKTLYVDFYYNSTNNNAMTVYCTWLDPNITDKGTYSITWENGAVVDDSLTVVSSLDIPRDITAPGTGFFYVIGTQNASTASWTGTIPVSKLHNGLTIAYYLPYASAASTNVTLNLTLSTGATTGAINVYYTGASRMTTHYGAGSTIILTYFEAGAISVGGTATTDARWTHSDYNTNTNTAVNVTLNTSTKAYILATTSTPTSTATARTAVGDTAIYMHPEAGAIHATYFYGNQYRATSGGTWIAGRTNASVYTNYSGTTGDSFYPLGFMKTNTGGWAIGTIPSHEKLYFSYTTDANFTNNTNTSTYSIYMPPSSGEVMVRKRTISQQNQSENIILNGQQLLYSGTGTISLGQIDVDITGLFTNWSVIMFTIIGYGFGSSGSNNKFSISGIVPLDLVKRYYEVYGSSSSSTVIVAGIQYNPSATAGNQYFYAQYVNDNKISFQCTMNGKSTSIEVYGLY